MEKVLFNHRAYDNKGRRCTFCGIFNTETREMTIGKSKCSTKDVFSKSIGRRISEGRARSTKVNLSVYVPTYITPSRALIDHIMQRDDILRYEMLGNIEEPVNS